MLERISEIQGIGLLHDANGKPYKCERATLVYADNGRGKSTIASVLRSSGTDDPALITRRKTIDGSLPPKVVLQFGSGHRVSFENGSWSERRPELLVFDNDFIELNVHSGGSVSTAQRKNLLQFALGEHAVAARLEVERSVEETKLANQLVQRITSELSGYHKGLSLDAFERLLHTDDIDQRLAELNSRVAAATNAATILSRPLPDLIEEPRFDLNAVFSILQSSLENVHEEASQVVRSHAAGLGQPDAENWLARGAKFDSHDSCPFCATSTVGNRLVDAYRMYFSGAYSKLIAGVNSIHGLIGTGTDRNLVANFYQRAETAAARTSAWAEQVSIPPLVFDQESAMEALTELQQYLMRFAHEKRSSPLVSRTTHDDVGHARALWDRVTAPMRTTNAAITSARKELARYKEELKREDIPKLRDAIQHLEARQRRHSPTVVALFEKLNAARAAAQLVERQKAAARETLDAEMEKILNKYEHSINELLSNFGTSFRIKGLGANFRGQGPRSEYGLELRGREIALDGGVPSFSTALSEGDKRALAFAFFVASTLADPKLATRIVVVDDPMCSLDLNRRHHTRSILAKICSHAHQLIILAHDVYFIRDLRDVLRRNDKNTAIALFEVCAIGNGYSGFRALDIDKACESAYFQHHRLVREFTEGVAVDARSVAKAIRPMLEGYLHRRFPGLLPTDIVFGGIIGLITAAVPPDPRAYAKPLVPELNDINDYAGQFHHDTNRGNADTVPVVASELHAFTTRALRLMYSGTKP